MSPPAFDSLTVSVLEKALRFCKIHLQVVAAFLRELQFLACKAECMSLLTLHPISFNASLRQGVCDSGFLWNLVMLLRLRAWARFLMPGSICSAQWRVPQD